MFCPKFSVLFLLLRLTNLTERPQQVQNKAAGGGARKVRAAAAADGQVKVI